ncbi:phenylalanine--tRNA ligase subunit beta [Corynebacterium pyruviciproducens]|uniref:phenylalanine--tRNA ligase subunit beta n=1 Tax=Corynebacterium pyruviciproducens TaxID=598660 RepID=UPI0023F134BF|nr:phenylalanine--tRNA ligase subunit beta [Corynebacterium pyruviciproducens]
MLISKGWVTRLLRASNPDNSQWSVSDEELDSGYVRVGFETEGYEPIEETTGPLVFGRVENIEELTGFKKPIRNCKVNVGDANGTGELQNIICGARNFKEGDLVVISLPGTVLPGGFTISARKTYSHISEGMICSAAELGLTAAQNKGIITLPEGFGEPGEPAADKLGLTETVFDVNITPDRGYALSARGLTRELASAFNLNFVDPAVHPEVAGLELPEIPAPTGSAPIEITIDPETQTRRFGLRHVRGIDPNAESPYWLQRELMLSGLRPVNAPTDVTNYVMLLLGLPMHAFDADKIAGGLTIRNAHKGEEFTAIDHSAHKLHEEDVVICDDNRAQSLAGVMGGTTSEIEDAVTTNVFFEAAVWEPVRVARTSRRRKISSDASRRYERGVDSALVEVALDVACALLVKIAGGEATDERFLYGEPDVPASITMDVSYPARVAGYEYDSNAVVSRFEEIGAQVDRSGDTLTVTPPTWRGDLQEKCDLVEEVTRLEGLDKIPSLIPQAPAGDGLSASQLRRRHITHALAYSGYVEILPTPFIATDTFDTWGLAADDERRNVVTVQNPLESDHSVLGTTLLPSMLDAVRRNVVRGATDLSLYGVEQVAINHGDGKSPMPDTSARPSDEEDSALRATLPHQPLYVATVGVGNVDFAGPWGEGRAYTFADAIESARVVARAADVQITLENAEYLPWHPGRCAAIRVDGEVVGHAGELHPQVLEKLGLPARTCAMEMNISALPFEPSAPAPVLSAFPTNLQDIALVVDEDVPAEAVRATVQEGAGELAEKVELFDIYRSEALGENKKSLAFAVTFRAPDRTLTDDEASAARHAAVDLAVERFGAVLRGE